MRKQIPQIAVVDDDAPVRNALVRLLRSAGIDAPAFASGAAFIDSLHAGPPA